jgi:hypothetical protein
VVIYENAARLGGTWRDNAYPGRSCDVLPSHAVSTGAMVRAVRAASEGRDLMDTPRGWLMALIALVVALRQTPIAMAKKAPPGFRYIPEWGVYANPEDVLWYDGVRWTPRGGSWLRLETDGWILDANPPAVLLGIPPDRLRCPPGLAKKGCIPPGQQKKHGSPGRGKHRH